jgi:preprotein translocase subunit SecB
MEKSKQLTVETYQVEELHVTRNAAYREADRGQFPRRPDVSLDFHAFTNKTELDQFALSLYVKSDEPATEEQPLQFSIQMTGFFRLAEALPDGKLPAERIVNGLTILYGIVRARLGDAASWFNAPIVAPTVYFTDLVAAKIEAAKKRESEPERLLDGASTA